ncbi:hypothetical protein CHCC14566_1830 [Bacillus licheniformis]|nr:hypothetical protein CHCC14566_1830 [Bacillus licheniformis]
MPDAWAGKRSNFPLFLFKKQTPSPIKVEKGESHMKKLLNWMKRPSISKKLIFSFIFILTIPILVLSVTSYFTASSTLEDEILRSAYR